MFVVYNSILRHFPAKIYSIFHGSDNTFATTIFVLVSAVQKISTRMRVSPGTQLYRQVFGVYYGRLGLCGAWATRVVLIIYMDTITAAAAA